MTIQEHAASISAAIAAAAADGFELDDGDGCRVSLDLNVIVNGRAVGEYVEVAIPESSYSYC